MSAPDSRDSKARPSLLSDTAHDGADNGSRILANLEGRVVAQPLKSSRSRKPWIFAAVIALAGVCAFGAWQWQHILPGNGEKLATTPAAGGVGAQKPAATAIAANASAALVAAAAVPASGIGAAPSSASSPSQAAVIVTDNASSVQSAPSVASATAAAAAAADSADGGRLSRALAAGAEAPKNHASAAAPEQAKHAAHAHSATKAVALRNGHESETKRHAERVAAERSRKASNAAAKPAQDEDVDLLTALVARTKPYDSKQRQVVAKEQATSSPQKRTAQSGNLRQASLAEQVAECSKRGLIEEQFCRWHVCSDHWGKDPACPSSTPSVSH